MLSSINFRTQVLEEIKKYFSSPIYKKIETIIGLDKNVVGKLRQLHTSGLFFSSNLNHEHCHTVVMTLGESGLLQNDKLKAYYNNFNELFAEEEIKF